uniref:Uncharacterized protein n=1 Tax=Ananas comosus var. bracteatus TaxID=296719 RepID=A0A6V7NET3_ANACO|nr:unnamed protein product [Ananas comosus var. bracteatus]
MSWTLLKRYIHEFSLAINIPLWYSIYLSIEKNEIYEIEKRITQSDYTKVRKFETTVGLNGPAYCPMAGGHMDRVIFEMIGWAESCSKWRVAGWAESQSRPVSNLELLGFMVNANDSTSGIRASSHGFDSRTHQMCSDAGGGLLA